MKSEDRRNRMLPVIRRARGFRLYGLDGKRYLDFYLNGGRALLGHRVQGMTRVMKSTAARGLLAEYPSVYTPRLEKALRPLFPSPWEFRIFSNRERLLHAVSPFLKGGVPGQEPAGAPGAEVSGVPLWRPYLPLPGVLTRFFIPVLPFPASFGPEILCINADGLSLSASDSAFSVLSCLISDPVSPFLLDSLIKTAAELRKALDREALDAAAPGWRRFDSPPEIEAEAGVHQMPVHPGEAPSGTGETGHPLWKRSGPYLDFLLKDSGYNKFQQAALGIGILLPPNPGSPAIIPAEYDEGEVRPFFGLLKEEPWR